MATLKDFIFNRLTTYAPVTAIVGTRVYRQKMPDNPTLPAVTYEVLSDDGAESFDGDSGLYMPVVGVHGWAREESVADDLAKKLRAALIGYSGTYSDRTISKILEWTRVDLYDNATAIYHVACSCRVWYS